MIAGPLPEWSHAADVRRREVERLAALKVRLAGAPPSTSRHDQWQAAALILAAAITLVT